VSNLNKIIPDSGSFARCNNAITQGELFYLLRKMKKFEEKLAKFYAAEILLAL
jgi:hypothetical protein